MAISRYCDGSSIPVDSLNRQERRQAIKEWSEGNPFLRELLHECYRHQVKTTACCAHYPYISVQITGSSLSKLHALFHAAEKIGNVRFQMHLNAPNPNSGPNWFQESISISPLRGTRKNEFLCKLSLAFLSFHNQTSDIFSLLESFFLFLSGKDSELSIDVFIQNHSHYQLILECNKNKRNAEFYSPLFTRLGLKTPDFLQPNFPILAWELESNNKDAFYEQAYLILNEMKENWTLPMRMDLSEDMPFSSKALLMRRKLGTSPEGIQQWNEWIKANRHHP